MFEQSSYAPETEETPDIQEGGLFSRYELKGWELSKRVYQILGVSAFLNIIALLVFSQTSVLTMKGCDSPLVGSVCQALDTVYVGALLFGTDREVVDAEYKHDDLGEMEITYIDVTGVAPPLSYPEGYFQIANPVQWEMMQQQQAMSTESGFPGSPGISPFQAPQPSGSLLDTKPNPPIARNNVVDGDLPTDFGNNPIGSDKTTNPIKSGRNATTKGKTPANVKPCEGIPGCEAEMAKINPDPGTKDEMVGGVNSRPFKDLAKEIIKLRKESGLSLETPFLVTAKGKLNKDGKIEKKSFAWGKAESGDKNMLLAVRRSIETFNDSGFLRHISELSGKTLDIALQQDQANISATVQTMMESDMRAVSTVGILKLAKQLEVDGKAAAIAELEATLAAEKDPVKNAEIQQKLQNTKDDLALINGMQIAAAGKSVVITFAVEKTAVHEMLNRKLDAEAKIEGDTTRPEKNSNTAKK